MSPVREVRCLAGSRQQGKIVTDPSGWPSLPHACPCLQPDQGMATAIITVKLHSSGIHGQQRARTHGRPKQPTKSCRTTPLIFSRGELELN
jgi:hypothetical protein